jgi:hypothetical protein
MKKKVVYLAMQSQLESILRDWRVVRVAIHRIEKREWIPLLDIENDAGQAYTCAIRVKKDMEPRTWSDLRALVDWLDTRVGVKECRLSLSDFEWESETLAVE